MVFPNSVESTKCCFGQTLGQAYRRMIFLDLFSFVFGILRFVARVSSSRSTIFLILASLGCLLSASLQIIIGGISPKRSWPNESGRFSKYYLFAKIVYLILFSLDNSLVTILMCQNEEDLDEKYCQYSTLEIAALVIWFIMQLCFLQTIARVWKLIKLENQNSQRNTANSEHDTRRNVEDETDIIAEKRKGMESLAIEVIGIPFTLHSFTEYPPLKKKISIISSERIETSRKTVSLTNVEKLDFVGPDSNNWDVIKTTFEKLAQNKIQINKLHDQQPDSEGCDNQVDVQKNDKSDLEKVEQATRNIFDKYLKYRMKPLRESLKKSSSFLARVDSMFKQVKN